MIDTHGSADAARGVVDDVRRLGAGDVVAIVNTHCHFDHVFGNDVVSRAWGGLPVHAHETVPDEIRVSAERIRQAYADDPDDPKAAEVAATIAAGLLLPTDLFSSAAVLDLGDRALELVHPGRGHTAGDIVVRVPDADVVLAGDLVEESADPAFGEDCWPMDWPLSLDLVLSLTTGGSVVVPGHGAPVDREFVEQQRNDIGIVAETIRDLAGRGVPEREAVAAADWPFDPSRLGHAVRRGYEQLPRSQKRLPLL
jgi:glyoxylase-like metal-dependent hydrolase (beta-lactamase superfamily II)